MLNRFKTAALLAFLTALFLFTGNLLGGTFGLAIAIVLAIVMNFGTYWFSDRLILRFYRAQQIGADDDPQLFGMVTSLANRAQIPMPKVYLIPESAPNAFATGRNPKNAAVAVTNGLRAMLSRDEMYGVLAHEIAQIKNRDTLIMTIAGAIGGAIGLIAEMAFWSSLFGSSDDDDGSNPVGGLLGLILAPIAAMLIQMSISRSREFVDDETGAKLSGDPRRSRARCARSRAWSAKVPLRAGNPATFTSFYHQPVDGKPFAIAFQYASGNRETNRTTRSNGNDFVPQFRTGRCQLTTVGGAGALRAWVGNVERAGCVGLV